ncbi:MAG: Gfo/Idh/MocA family oxidoreductase [Spirochaetes bacterium]|nr:Gfo/Idh/MocA family oxidoreductase [Spirochaetota bacterium]
MKKSTIHFGIIATGNIAHKFADQFQKIKNAQLLAIGSRSQKKAKQFAKKFDIPRAYGSYSALAEDPDIRAVYIATPHHLHKENTIMALTNGKAVLVEKPFAINAIQAKEMIDLAKSRKQFIMEAMWMRFNPSLVRMKELIDSGVIGTIVQLHADFGFFAPYNPDHRLFNPVLGGGALLDIGIYPISLASWLLGYPDDIKSFVIKGKTGVDEINAITFFYQKGAIATLTSNFRSDSDRTVYISGTKGSILLDSAWHRSLKLTLMVRGQEPKIYQYHQKSMGLFNETQHMVDCLLSGKLESHVISLSESLKIMEIMDQIRKQWALVYPGE